MANLRTDNLYGVSGPDANGSALFNGTDHLTAANAAAFRLNQGSTENFTMEAWIYVTGDTFMRVGRIYETSGNQRSYDLYLSSDLEIKFNYSSNGTAGGTSTLTGNVIAKNEWVHVAIAHEVSTTTLRLFQNGLNVATDNAPHTTYYANTTSDFTLGEAFIGNISNFHITKSCKYTGNFTPSKEPIEEDSNTTVLCLNSRLDVLNDEKSNVFSQTTAGGVKASTLMPFSRADDGVTFDGAINMNSQDYMYFSTGRTEERGRGRAVIFAGSVTPVSPNFSSNIDYIEMRSSGVGVRFGNCTGNSHHGSCGSSTRGFMFGGQIGSPDVQTNLIEFVTIASEGNSIDFGDLLRAKRRLTGQGHSNSTRAILAGGGGDAPLAPDNVIQFFTMATTGDATDFGDLNAAKDNSAGTGSPTRMLIAGGRDYTPSATVVNKIEYITMSTTGNVTDFGDLTVARAELARASNAVRSVFVSGGTPSPKVNTIDFVTTATTGDATDFGDLPIAKGGMASANNSIIGIFVAGTTGSRTTDIQSLTIATTGNGVAFGDCNVTDPSQGREGCSDSHGGLS